MCRAGETERGYTATDMKVRVCHAGGGGRRCGLRREEREPGSLIINIFLERGADHWPERIYTASRRHPGACVARERGKWFARVTSGIDARSSGRVALVLIVNRPDSIQVDPHDCHDARDNRFVVIVQSIYYVFRGMNVCMKHVRLITGN